MTVKQRMAIEREIVLALALAAINEGYSITIHNGGDEPELFASRSIEQVKESIMLCDEEELAVVTPRGKTKAWFFLVYGNSGYDVICDYGINALAERLNEKIEPIIEKYDDSHIYWRADMTA